VIKVTGNTSRGEGRRGTGTVRPDSPFVAFGPQSFTRDPAKQLYTESVDAGRAHARSDSFWVTIAEKIAKKAADIGRGVVRGYSREAVPSYAYARTGDLGDVKITGPYSPIDGIVDRYEAKPATQSWLKRATGKKDYVFGAAVTEGSDAGIYVDEGLLLRAGKYVSNLTRGLTKKAKEYAGDFVETLLTLAHEDGHLNKGIRDEQAAEHYAKQKVYRLAEADSSVGFALKEYRRPQRMAA
jgi:hypothetical protein